MIVYMEDYPLMATINRIEVWKPGCDLFNLNGVCSLEAQILYTSSMGSGCISPNGWQLN